MTANEYLELLEKEHGREFRLDREFVCSLMKAYATLYHCIEATGKVPDFIREMERKVWIKENISRTPEPVGNYDRYIVVAGMCYSTADPGL
jgi:hypothetical protein